MTVRHTGLKLDEDFDFEVDNTGDLAAVANLDELEKDLSGAIVSILNEHGIGFVPTVSNIAGLEQRIESRILRDDRVLNVREVTIDAGADANVLYGTVEVDSLYGILRIEETE